MQIQIQPSTNLPNTTTLTVAPDFKGKPVAEMSITKVTPAAADGGEVDDDEGGR